MLAFLWALPPRRAAAAHRRADLYLLACLLCLLIHSPVGSNIERYGVLLAGPLLLCVRLGAPGQGDSWRSAAAWRAPWP